MSCLFTLFLMEKIIKSLNSSKYTNCETHHVWTCILINSGTIAETMSAEGK